MPPFHGDRVRRLTRPPRITTQSCALGVLCVRFFLLVVREDRRHVRTKLRRTQSATRATAKTIRLKKKRHSRFSRRRKRRRQRLWPRRFPVTLYYEQWTRSSKPSQSSKPSSKNKKPQANSIEGISRGPRPRCLRIARSTASRAFPIPEHRSRDTSLVDLSLEGSDSWLCCPRAQCGSGHSRSASPDDLGPVAKVNPRGPRPVFWLAVTAQSKQLRKLQTFAVQAQRQARNHG